jgi:hypothetical protein
VVANIKSKVSNCSGVDQCVTVLESLRSDHGVQSSPGIPAGVELAILILKDGASTIYSPQYYTGPSRPYDAGHLPSVVDLGKEAVADIAGGLVSAGAICVKGAIEGIQEHEDLASLGLPGLAGAGLEGCLESEAVGWGVVGGAFSSIKEALQDILGSTDKK